MQRNESDVDVMGRGRDPRALTTGAELVNHLEVVLATLATRT